MAEKSKAELNKVIELITAQTEAIKEIKTDTKQIVEVIDTIYQIVNDLSGKYDMFLTKEGVKKPVTKKASKTTTTISKPEGDLKNIMIYFKSRYKQNPNVFDDCIKSAEYTAEEFKKKIFDDNEEDLKDKSGEKRLQLEAACLYTKLNTKQKTKIREMMKQEIDKQNGNKETQVSKPTKGKAAKKKAIVKDEEETEDEREEKDEDKDEDIESDDE